MSNKSYLKCLVKNCTSYSHKDVDRTFYYLPTDEERRRKWLKAIDVCPTSLSTKRNYLCDLHFAPEAHSVLTLKRTAVPSLHLNNTISTSSLNENKNISGKRVTTLTCDTKINVTNCEQMSYDAEINIKNEPFESDEVLNLPLENNRTFLNNHKENEYIFEKMHCDTEIEIKNEPIDTYEAINNEHINLPHESNKEFLNNDKEIENIYNKMYCDTEIEVKNEPIDNDEITRNEHINLSSLRNNKEIEYINKKIHCDTEIEIKKEPIDTDEAIKNTHINLPLVSNNEFLNNDKEIENIYNKMYCDTEIEIKNEPIDSDEVIRNDDQNLPIGSNKEFLNNDKKNKYTNKLNFNYKLSWNCVSSSADQNSNNIAKSSEDCIKRMATLEIYRKLLTDKDKKIKLSQQKILTLKSLLKKFRRENRFYKYKFNKKHELKKNKK